MITTQIEYSKADPSPLACVSAFTFNFGSDGSRWFPAGFCDLHHMFINPGVLLEFLMYDQGGFPFCHGHNPCDTALAKQRHSLVR